MVFLIKKNARGDRSVSLRSHSYENDLTGLIEAMKGLTFKIEIKVTDITKEMPVDAQTLETAEVPNQEKIMLPVPSDMVFQAGVKTPPVVDNGQPKCLKENVAPAPTLNKADVKAQEILETLATPQPERVMKPISDSLEVQRPALANVQVINGTKPAVPEYPVGTVDIGSEMVTCCIAVDNRGPSVLAYITYNDQQLIKTDEIINANVEIIENSPEVTSYKVGDVVLTKSSQDNQWYRSIIESVSPGLVDIFFFDWGLRETVTTDRIRALTIPGLKLIDIPACAVKLKLNARSQYLVEAFLKMETACKLKIDSYDEATRAYEVTVHPAHE